MARIKDFFRRHILWVGFLAVIVPLLIILSLQYRSLVKLEKTSPIADKVTLKNYLYAVHSEIQEFYYLQAKQALNLPFQALGENHQDLIIGHFKQHEVKGVKRLFVATFPKSGDPQVLFFNPWRQTLEPSPDSPELRAVNAACSYWKLLAREGTVIEMRKLAVEEKDPENRVLLYPVLDESAKVSGAAGLILDSSYFKETFLPTVVRNSLPKFFSSDAQDNLIVTVHDSNKCLVLTTQPIQGQGEDAYYIFSPIFRDWRLSIRSRDLTPEQWARRYFAINLSLSVLMTLVLIGGIILALRTASREMRLSQMKADFVSNVSHELRTPLSSIRVFGEFLRLGRVKDAEKTREYGEYIETESRRLTQLINNILDFSKIESGQKTYRFEQAEVGEVVAATLKTFEVRLKQNGFAVIFEAPPAPLPPAVFDADAISQALLNLLDNAVKYSGPAKEIRVRLDRPDNLITISVTDYGIGIPRQEQEKIFERFHRVSTGLVHDVKGSGLGLAIVKHIVEAHQGKVTVESQPDQGSTFTIHLPVDGPASAPTKRQTPKSVAENQPPLWSGA